MEKKPHIIDRIANVDKYVALNPHFAKAFAFLKRPNLPSLPVGRYEIDGTNCWAMISEPTVHPLEGAKLETHRKYIDIQAPLTAPETFGLAVMSEDEQKREPFDLEKDYVLYTAPMQDVTVNPGEFAIFFPPNGAHAPCCAKNGSYPLKKLVIKVLAE